jgi:hypothetical protein
LFFEEGGGGGGGGKKKKENCVDTAFKFPADCPLDAVAESPL